MTYAEIQTALNKLADPEKGKFLQRYFKTGSGEYAEGDIFIGLTVPQQRTISKQFKDLSLNDVVKLLQSRIHEERLTALFILNLQFKKAPEKEKKKIVDVYLKNLAYVNNWDLVDQSAPQILGNWLLDKDRAILYKLAHSKNLWKQRVAILSTYAFISNKEYEDTFAIAEILMDHKHDLIHKAMGWMLREVGKRVGVKHLYNFLEKHVTELPRTALRYSIEKLPEEERKQWLAVKK